VVHGHNIVTSVVGRRLVFNHILDTFDGELTPLFPFVAFTTFGLSFVVIEVVTPWAMSMIVLR
jgi:hypothetical protein